MDNNYSVTSLTYNNNAGSFTFGTANSSTLTLAGGSMTNNSVNTQTLNVPIITSGAQILSMPPRAVCC